MIGGRKILKLINTFSGIEVVKVLSYKNTNIKLALFFSHRDLDLGAPNGIIWGKY